MQRDYYGRVLSIAKEVFIARKRPKFLFCNFVETKSKLMGTCPIKMSHQLRTSISLL